MRHVDRSSLPAPASLTQPDGAGARERTRYLKHRDKPAPKKAFVFSAYKEDDVRHSLEALFHGKCAYCESRYDVTAPVDIEHFRPKGVDPAGTHQGYWWLAATWSNLLPACIDCNRRRWQPTPVAMSSLSNLLASSGRAGPVQLLQTGKESCFPVAGARVAAEPDPAHLDALLAAENALLLDPCRDDPAQHLRFYIDRDDPLGIVFPRGDGAPHLPPLTNDPAALEATAIAAHVSPRGAVSIQTYGLNRLRLVQARTQVLRQLEFLSGLALDLAAVADKVESLRVPRAQVSTRTEAVAALRSSVDRLLAQLRAMGEPQAPFSAMVASWLERFLADQ